MVLYKYGMRLRGFSLGCQPMEGLWRADDDYDLKYHSLLWYKRKLTDKEVIIYELDYLGEVEE